MRSAIKRRAIRVALLATGLLAAAGGIAYATIPDTGGVYTACMLRNVGTVRLIDSSLPSTNPMSHCTSLETQITWNAKGEKGDQGPAGVNGRDGKDGLNGTNGVDGKDGLNGTNGVDGKDGKDGVSVRSEVEPAGANCANGGSKFTAAHDSVTYACNGADGAGPLGQSGHTVYGSAPLLLPAGSSEYEIVPGLSESISVPSGRVVYVATDGGLENQTSAGGTVSDTRIAVLVDGAQLPDGVRVRDVICVANNAGLPICNWSQSAVVPLSAGEHTISVAAKTAAGVATWVSSDDQGVLQGELTAIVLKQ